MREFRLIALTPPGSTDAAIAIAASRAGEIGVLDLEYVQDKNAGFAALSKLAQFARRDCGIKLDGSDERFFTEILSQLPSQVRFIILSPGDSDGLRRRILACQQLNLKVFLETTSQDEAHLGEELGVDGLIAKGHEAGGRVGEETTFILLQRLLANTTLPVWAQGGIGLHTVAACYEAGAAGAVLDAQLLLTRESSVSEQLKTNIARMDGSETICVGSDFGSSYRLYHRPGLSAVAELRGVADQLSRRPVSKTELAETWRAEVKSWVGGADARRKVWLLGQDATFAAPLAERFRTVGGVLDGMRQAIAAHGQSVRAQRPIDQHSTLARSHGTRYPIVQGPMTRVSDRATFAAQVAEAGGLPFLALALMRAPEVKALLEETRQVIGDRPWGVGILGFVPLAMRQEQMEVIQACRPSFALIAGGRPDQALALEHAGIPTYLHVPSPGLLKLFVENGARRFVFEGRECGGHVGPRSSFVLWNTMIDTLLETMPASETTDCHVLFAGGIHDALSASMVATMAAPLAERGAGIGVLLGTAYLFTKEAVVSGAIREGFQQEAIRCKETVLLETGPGHATRCTKSPFVEMFRQEKQRLSAGGKPAEEIRESLERLNLGRLRIASKGISRHPQFQPGSQSQKYLELSNEEQLNQGMFMIGQVAALRDSTCTIEELHHEVSVTATERLANLPAPRPSRIRTIKQKPCDVAIIGMSCLLPKAPDLQTYWDNILNKVDAITEIPKERWDWQRYFDADAKARDKIYSKWGGFVDEISFDPIRYGMPPNTLTSIEPLQLLTLEVVRAALEDAGYTDRPFPRHLTSVILGVGGGISDLGQHYALRSGLPILFDDVPPDVLSRLPEWTEDSFAGILLNVAAGRVANRFDLGGVNYTVDAACASSLAAVYLATRELEAGTSDMVIVGGADTVQNPFGYLCFSKTNALSPRGRCRTFDESADGIAISEGVAVLVLKRLTDAERDGDRIYAVIKSVAGSSDGRDKGLTAPRPEGQALALERAYAKAGFSPATVGLIEAHGTGTVAGDKAEIETLKTVFDAAGAARQTCAIGSVKSMIGHTKCTAGVAGLIKIALALNHRVLPPTINVEKPNPTARFPESPFYVNTEPRPWFKGIPESPRRAGVSAFGFGGTNFHVVVEEYTGNFIASGSKSVSENWPSELLVWSADSLPELLAVLAKHEELLSRSVRPRLPDLAFTLWHIAEQDRKLKLAIVATSPDDLLQKLVSVRTALNTSGTVTINDPRGIYFTAQPLSQTARIAFLFPGQGSQAVGMLRDLVTHFTEVRDQFEIADEALRERFPERLSSYVYPPPGFSTEEHQARLKALTRTDVAQPALGAAGMGLCHLLRTLGIRPDMAAGHSFGEYVALCSAGVFTEETLYRLAEARGRCIINAAEHDLGTMAAVTERADRVKTLLESVTGVWIANRNAPRQTVISGTREGIGEATEILQKEGIQCRQIPVACAFHSPLVAPARDRLAQVLSATEFATPTFEVYSNSSAATYPADPKAVAESLANHLITPVRFADEIEAMYSAGARIFIEVGPNNVLTSLTNQILEDCPHLAVAVDGPHRPGVLHLQHTLGQLFSHGLRINLDRLYSGRNVQKIDFDKASEQEQESRSTSIWMVNGGRARPLREAALADPRETKPPISVTVKNASDEPDHRVPVAASVPVSRSLAPSRSDGSLAAPISKVAGSIDPPLLATNSAAKAPGPTLDVSTSLPTDSNAGPVVLQFQQLMRQFLETQQHVMLAYLHGSSNGSAASNEALPLPAELKHYGAVTEAEPSGNGQPATVSPEATNVSPAVVLATPLDSVTGAESSGGGEVAAGKESAAGRDRRELTRKLIEIVSERTGYPPDMLDLDLNMEADLGIDSIKRVEILGVFQRLCFQLDQQKTRATMEKWTGIKTLRGIIDSLDDIFSSDVESRAAKAATEPEAESKPETPIRMEDTGGLPRFLVRLVEAPYRETTAEVLASGVFVITDDERGVAQSLAEKLAARGVQAVLVRAADQNTGESGDQYRVDLTDSTAVVKLLDTIRQEHQSRIGAIIHLLPLRPKKRFEQMEFAEWRNHLRLEVRSLFLLARAASPDFKTAGVATRNQIVATTAIGRNAECEQMNPGHGGINGLVKTLAVEWPDVKCQTVDLAGDDSASGLAERLLHEIAGNDAHTEVFYDGARRFIPQPSLSPLGEVALPMLDSNSVVLVVGGARGITAEVALELARCYRPTILLAGRSPQADPQESTETAHLVSPREVKAALISELQRSGIEPTPQKVEAAYSRRLNDREMRRNIAAIQEAGATVHYYQVDVRDERAFGSFIDELYQRFQRLDGVIYGAGVIEDKLVEDKTLDSFDRVFDTKSDGAFVLSRKLRPDSLKILVFFSSVAGRFGNRGQSDYAAANQVLDNLAIYLDRRWPARVVSINWGPWEKTGMVSAEVRRQFQERGVQIIRPDEGRCATILEIERGRKGDVEVILGDGPWQRTESAASSTGGLSLPLLRNLTPTASGSGIEIIRVLDTDHDLYLRDHKLDGLPVLPAAMAMELMAEVARRGWPEFEVTGVEALRVLSGIIVENGPKPIRVAARAEAQPDREESDLSVDVNISDTSDQRTFYRATVRLGKRLPVPPENGRAELAGLRPFAMNLADVYDKWLFHGPLFQRIISIDAIGEEGMTAAFAPSFPAGCLGDPNAGEWLIDPMIIDSAFQLAIIWSRTYTDMTPLPARFERYRRFAPLRGSNIHCEFRARAANGGHNLETQISLFGSDGRLLGMLEGMEFSCSKTLNRLAMSKSAGSAQ